MNKTIQNILYFSISVVFVKAIGMFNTFYLAKLLIPAEYGVWVTLVLVTSYASIASLGTLEALIKMYPYYMGKDQIENAYKTEKGVFGSILFSSGLYLAIGILITFLINKSVLFESVTLIRIMIIASSISLFSSFYYFRLTSHQDFNRAGIVDAIRSVTNFCFIITFSKWWGLKGTVIGYLINECVMVFVSYFYCKAYKKLSPSFNWKLIFNLIKIGLPITIVWWIYMIQSSISRIISMHFLGKTSTGYLGLGVSIVSVLVLIPLSIGRVLYPKINEEIGKSEKRNMDKFVIMPAKLISLVVAMSLGVLVIITPWLIATFFKKYLPAVSCTILLLVSGYFSSMNRNGINYLIAANRQKAMLYYVSVALLINLALCLLFVKLKYGVTGIALGTDISTLVFSCLIWQNVFKNMNYQLKKQIEEFIKLYLPFFITSILLSILWLFFNFTTEKDLIKYVLYIILYSISYLAFFIVLPVVSINYFKEIASISSLRKLLPKWLIS
jgi:O-antigen/teichoic acid export membrane protein